MKRARFLFLLLLFCLLVPAWAQPDFSTVPQALREGRDQDALAACRALEQAGQASFGSLYNEGLAWRNLGQPARARAAFERALLLDPHSLSTRQRLRELDQQLGQAVLELDVRGTPWWRNHEAELLLLLPGLALLLAGGMARWRGTRPPATPMLLLFLLGLAGAALVVLTSPARERAVVIDPGARLLTEPKSGSGGDTVPAGCLVELLQRQDHYLKIRLGDGQEGWLRAAQLQELTLPQQPASEPTPTVAQPAVPATPQTLKQEPDQQR